MAEGFQRSWLSLKSRRYMDGVMDDVRMDGVMDFVSFPLKIRRSLGP